MHNSIKEQYINPNIQFDFQPYTPKPECWVPKTLRIKFKSEHMWKIQEKLILTLPAKSTSRCTFSGDIVGVRDMIWTQYS